MNTVVQFFFNETYDISVHIHSKNPSGRRMTGEIKHKTYYVMIMFDTLT